MAAFDIYNRVWKFSRQRGLKKLLMLAFAKHANDAGICWPSVETLCALTGESDHSYIRRLTAELVRDGELTKRAGGGRGKTTVYGILPGLDERAAADLRNLVARCKISRGQLVIDAQNSELESTVSVAQNSGLHNSVSENSVSESTVLPHKLQKNSGLENTVLENTVFQSQKTVDYSFNAETSNTSPPSPETPQNNGENYHGTHGDDGDVGAATKKTTIVSENTPARRKGPPVHVAYLSQQGMWAAHLFADCDPDAAIADFNARIADQWPIQSIVTAWKLNPPRPGVIYERRQHAENRAERPAHASSVRAPRPGEPEYYERFSRKQKA